MSRQMDAISRDDKNIHMLCGTNNMAVDNLADHGPSA